MKNKHSYLLPLQDAVTPLSMVCEKGHTSVVKLLLEAKAKTNVKNNVSFVVLVLNYWYCTYSVAAVSHRYIQKACCTLDIQ